MVSQITLGNIYQSGGKTVVSGSQSGIDTESLIKALTEAKRQPAVKLETKNAALDKQTSAYSALKTILAKFQTSLDALRNPPGVNNASQNIFQYRTSTLSASNSAYTASNYISMTVEPGASVQTFSINQVEQLAVAGKQESDNVFTLPTTTGTATSVVTASGVHTANSFAAGSFTLRGIDGAADATITLNEGDSLQSVVNKFNDVKGRTGIQANVLKVAGGTPDSTYKIIFTSTKTGEDYSFDLDDSDTVLSDTNGVLSMLDFNTTQPAKNAKVTIDNVQIERQSNAIDDVINGITFTLKQATPVGVTLNAAVAPDTDIVSNALTQFADVYNEFRIFVAKQQARDESGAPTEDAVLANATLLRTVMSQIATEVTRTVGGILGGNPERLADIGINFSDFAGDDTNPATKTIMVVDADKLKSALASNFDGVRGLFEFQLNSDSASLAIYKRTNGLSVSDFTLNIDRTNGVYTANYTDPVTGLAAQATLEGVPIGGSTGITLKGKAGTVFDGLELIFATGGDATVNVHATQGMGDRLYNLMEGITNNTTGTLAAVVTSLADQEERNNKEIVKIDSQIELYRDQLTQQYATLEAALSKANNLLSLLDAQDSARQANS